jgi:cyclohexanecarboxylate-CoA ligase
MWTQLEARAAESGDAPALHDDAGAALTFAELQLAVERVAAGLHELGIGAGSRVTWQLPTRIDTVVVMLALSRLGAVQNPVIHLYGQRELGFILRQTRAEWVIVQPRWRDIDYLERLRALEPELDAPPQVLLAEGTVAALPQGDPATLPPRPDDPHQVRWIFYTSGTSADPKGVCHTDASVEAAGHVLVACHDLTPDDVGSIAFPIAHAGGPQYLASMMEAGFPAVLIERFVPAETFARMREYGVSIVGGGPAFYAAVLHAQREHPDGPLLPRIRILTGGGAPKPPQLYYDVLREVGAPILHGLGMTEAPCITMGSLRDSDEQLAYTEGAPAPGMQVRIVDGEIQIKGTVRAVGYVDPALNATLLTDDGWLRTGDLGRIREDGHLVITGRQKDVIIRKGENISAREIEELLLQLPQVRDVAVIGLPDADRGELVCAVVEPWPTAAELTLADVSGHLRAAGLTVHKLPERLEFLEALPRNAFAKVSKAELRQQFSASSR